MHWSYNTENAIQFEVRSKGRVIHFLYDEDRGMLYDIRDFIKHLKLQEETEKMIERGYYYFDEKVNILLSINGSANRMSELDLQKLLSSIRKQTNVISTLRSSLFLNHYNFLIKSTDISNDLDYLQNYLNRETEFLAALSDAYEVSLSNLRYSPSVHKGW
jgi:hypothetical protein